MGLLHKGPMGDECEVCKILDIWHSNDQCQIRVALIPSINSVWIYDIFHTNGFDSDDDIPLTQCVNSKMGYNALDGHSESQHIDYENIIIH